MENVAEDAHKEEVREGGTVTSPEKPVEPIAVNIAEEIVPAAVRTENGAVEEAQRSNESTQSQSRQHSTPAASTSTSGVMHQHFDETFDEYFKKFLAAESSQLNDRDLRKFASEVPSTYVVPEDRHPVIYKALFKIKEFKNKAVFNDSLFLIQKIFSNLDFNKFLLGFWNCDEFKGRALGPMGYSFTEGRNRCDFSDVRPFDDITSKNAKIMQTAWSMLLDVEATIDFLINAYIDDKPMSVYFAIVLRRFKCLGDYMIKVNGKEIPMFVYCFRKAHDRAIASGHLIATTLTCLNTVTWTPKNGGHCYSLMKPNYALCETMNYFLRDDEFQPKYMQSLDRLFNPIDKFRCNIEWNSTSSNDFDNPTIFLFHFIKYYNRKNSIEFNKEVFYIIECFKKSLRHSGVRVTNFDLFEEEVESDWPFAYHILEFLEFPNFTRHIPDAIFKSLPECVAAKCLSLNEPDATLETALTGLFELFLVCRSSRPIPDSFYKHLLSTYGAPQSVIDVFAKCILQACNNLKNSINLKIDMAFVDFVSRICEFGLDLKIFEQFASMVEMNTDLIHRTIHLVILGRVVRLPLEEIYYREKRKPSLNELDSFVQDIFNVFKVKVHSKFGEFHTANSTVYPPWRKGPAATMEDNTSMAINHVLNAIQKEAFCIFDTSFGPNSDLLDLLLHLYKERRHFGLTFSRLDTILRNTYPDYFEHLEKLEIERNNARHQRQSQSDHPPPQRYNNSRDQNRGNGHESSNNYGREQNGGNTREPSNYGNNGREQSNNYGREQNGRSYSGSYENHPMQNFQRYNRHNEDSGTRNGSNGNY